MADLLLRFYAQLTGLKALHEFGSQDDFYKLTLAGTQLHQQEITLATATNAILYDSNDLAAPFSAMMILSNKALSVELQGASGATANSNFSIAADMPFGPILGTTRAYAAGGAFAGAAENIAKVTVRNDSGADARIAYWFPK